MTIYESWESTTERIKEIDKVERSLLSIPVVLSDIVKHGKFIFIANSNMVFHIHIVEQDRFWEVYTK